MGFGGAIDLSPCPLPFREGNPGQDDSAWAAFALALLLKRGRRRLRYEVRHTVWRELIRELTCDAQPIGDLDPGPDFMPGATSEELDAVEQALDVQLPTSLKELLSETNGVRFEFGTPLVWSADEIARANREMRNDTWNRANYMPFDDLLFFGGAGVDGILFAFANNQGRIDRDEVCAWYPIEDRRERKAASFRDYAVNWISGKMSL